jgi:hypothetical protein
MKTPLPAASATWAERYEALRRHVLEGGGLWENQPLGLALWLARGMAGWMGQWTQWTEATLLAPMRAPLALPNAVVDGWQRQVTLVLAQMTLGHLQPQGSP